jgi:hypothetical protein
MQIPNRLPLIKIRVLNILCGTKYNQNGKSFDAIEIALIKPTEACRVEF